MSSKDTAKGSNSGGSSRTRIIVARVLTVVRSCSCSVGALAFYVEQTALDEDGFETISRKMIENDEIRTQVAGTAVDKLFAASTWRRPSLSDCLRHSKRWRWLWRVSCGPAPTGCGSGTRTAACADGWVERRRRRSASW